MSIPPEPEPSAVVILEREGEVYLVKRPDTASFFPGFFAFPGGTTEDQDEASDELETLRRCAVRELEEETRVRLDPGQLEPAGVVVTPPFSPLRYRTQFFHVPVDDVDPQPQQPELAGGDWMRPQDALEAWEDGRLKLPPPVTHALQRLAQEGARALHEQGTNENRFPITFLPGVRVEALKVDTLPPHTHTNAFLIGDGELGVVDPGAPPPELDPLLETLDVLEDEGHELTHVLLTHHHEDHVNGLATLHDRFDPLVACSRETAARIHTTVDRTLEDGETLEIGGHTLEALATPGHAPGHTCYHLPEARTLLAGDLVAGVGSILVAPPQGHMLEYMDSLDRMATFVKEHGTRLVFPAHGPPQFDAQGIFQDTLEHRRDRESRVRDALGPTPRRITPIAKDAYKDKPEAPNQLKVASTHAHLVKLAKDGTVQETDDGWRTL